MRTSRSRSFGETTIVMERGDMVDFLDVHDIAKQFELTSGPDGEIFLPKSIMSDGVPPNSSASQSESPLVGGLDGIDPETGMWIGGGLIALSLYLFYRTTRG